MVVLPDMHSGVSIVSFGHSEVRIKHVLGLFTLHSVNKRISWRSTLGRFYLSLLALWSANNASLYEYVKMWFCGMSAIFYSTQLC